MRKKTPSQNTRTQTEFNKEAKQVVVRHKLFLIVVKMYFKIPLQIKRGQYLFKKFDTETTLKHSCTNLCIMILKVYYQNKCSLKLSSLITIKLYMFLIPKTIYMLNSWDNNPAFILSSITSSWFRWTYKHINLYNHTKIRRTAWGNKNKCCQL